MPQTVPSPSRTLFGIDRAVLDRILFFVALAIALAVTAGPSPWANGLRIIVP